MNTRPAEETSSFVSGMWLQKSLQALEGSCPAVTAREDGERHLSTFWTTGVAAEHAFRSEKKPVQTLGHFCS